MSGIGALRDGGRQRALEIPGLEVGNPAEVHEVRAAAHAISSWARSEVGGLDEDLLLAGEPAHAAGAEIRPLPHRLDPLGLQERLDELGLGLVRCECQPDELHQRLSTRLRPRSRAPRAGP